MTEIYDNYPSRNLLTRHPQPFRGLESLRGYVLRLTESNGYDSAWKVYVQAGLKQFEVRGAGFRVGKLASICNCSPIELQSIAYSQAAQPHFCYLLGEAVRVTDLEFSNPGICAKCIHRFGYIQGCWDLRLMIGCPIHDVQALSSCPSCGDSLSWYRRSMLTCSCGAALDDVDLAPLEPSERALLDLIYSKALNLLPFPDPQSRLPLVELSQMRLRMLLSVVQTIGTCWARTIALKSEAIGPQQIVASAARAFSDWPDNYFRLLTALARREFSNRYDIRQQFAPLYSALLKERGGTDSSALEFFRRAFMEFIGSHQTIRAADPRLMSEIQQQVQMRYQTRAALARSLRVDPRAVTRLLLTHETSDTGVPRFTPVDSSEFSLTGAKPSRILPEREASAKLGVPVSAFRKLVTSGVYHKKHRLPGQAGYDERDVKEMLSRLLARAGAISQDLRIASSVSFGEVMRMKRYSVPEKYSLIVAIASGDLKSFAEREAPDFRSVQIRRAL